MDPFTTTDPFSGDYPSVPRQLETEKNFFSGTDPFAFDPFPSDPFNAQTDASRDDLRPSFESLDPFKTFEATPAATSKHFQTATKDAATSDFQTFLAFEVSPPVTLNGIEVSSHGFNSKPSTAFEDLDPFSAVQVSTTSLQEHQVSRKVIRANPAKLFEEDPFCGVEPFKTTSREVAASSEFSRTTSALAFEDFTGFDKPIGISLQESGEIAKINSASAFDKLPPLPPAPGNPFSGQLNPFNFDGNDPFLTPVFPVPDSKESFKRSNAFEDSGSFEDLLNDGGGPELAFKASDIRRSSPAHDYPLSDAAAIPVPAPGELYLPRTPSPVTSFVSTQPTAFESTERSKVNESTELHTTDWLRFSNDPFSNISSNFPAAESQLVSHHPLGQYSKSNPFMEHNNGVIEPDKRAPADHVNDSILGGTSTDNCREEKVPPVSLSANISEQISSAGVIESDVTSESVVQAIRSGALRSQTADDDDQMEQTAPAIPPIPVGGLPPISRSFPGNSLSEEEEASYSKSEPSSTFPFSTTRPLLNDILDEHSIQQETNDAFLSRINGIDESSRDHDERSENLTDADDSHFSSDQHLSKPNGILDPPKESPTTRDQQQPQRDLKPYLIDRNAVVDRRDLQMSPDGDHRRPPLQTETEDVTGQRERVSDDTQPISVLQDELPPASFTKTMLAKFKQMEEEQARNRQLVPLRTKSEPSTPVRRPIPTNDEGRRKVPPPTRPTPSSFSTVSSTEGQSSSGDGVTGDACVSPRDGAPLETVDEMPQRGFAKNLLAQWRMLEAQDICAKERSEQKKRPPVTTRSQSLSRIEENQRSYFERAACMSKSYAVADSESVSETSSVTLGEEGGPGQHLSVTGTGQESSSCDEDYLPPPLMTRYVLAKFRDLEQESQIIAGIQPKPRKDEKQEKSFKWEVKEAVPLSRGGLIVHGDLPRGMSTANHLERKRSISEPGTSTQSVTDDDGDAVLKEDDLPPPELTKALLAHFRLIEESRNGTSDAPRGPGSRHRVQVRSEGQPETPDSNEHESWGRGSDDAAITPTQQPPPHPGNQSDEMPEQGTTRSLLAKFQLMQSSR